MIAEILEIITTEQRRQLMYAFERGFDQYVELTDEKFIGVNVPPLKHLEVLEEAGAWSYGTIKKER